MGDFFTERDIKIMKSNVASGLFDGTIFAMCWGGLYGPAMLYQPNISSQQYRQAIFKYLGKSLAKGAPLVAMTRIVGDICESKKVGPVTQFSITFVMAIAYITLVKFP